VRDTGIGMMKEQTKNLFLPFSQVDDSTTRKYGGTGLGLSICKNLVELMDGDIWVDSVLGEGSTFTFDAWFERHDEEILRRPSTIPDLRGVRVLVVDDNAAAREILCGLLSDLELRATSVASGEEALTAIKNAEVDSPYRLILMDWRMPGMDGIKASRAILDLPGCENMPIIIVTAFGRDDVREAAAQVGIKVFLGKPVSASSLYDALVGVVGGSALAPGVKAAPPADATARSRVLAGMHVLLVEDNSINQQIATELLQSAGAMVSLAADGAQAVELVVEGKGDAAERMLPPFDVVLMDVQMPRMDGREATRRIRQDSRFNTLPIIGLTAHALLEERLQSLSAGMNDLITKPIDPIMLIEVLEQWVHPAGSESGLAPLEPAAAERGLHHTAHLAIDRSGIRLVPSDELMISDMLELPGIDLESGLAHAAGNKKLYLGLLHEFVSTREGVVGEIEQALTSDDQGKALNLIHSLKGVAGNLGARALYTCAQALEEAIGTGAPATVQLAAFTEAVRVVVDGMKALLAAEVQKRGERKTRERRKSASPEGAIPLSDEGRAMLSRLRELLVSCDGEAVEHLENSWVKIQGLPGLSQLRSAVQRFEFDEALAVLDASMAKM
jgi:two-component system sensor histidine kinase/response regulator